MKSVLRYFLSIGNDDEMDQDGNVELSELNGKSVTTALGKTPIEAWSQCLIKLGLVDEIIVEQANEVLKTWQEDVMEGKVVVRCATHVPATHSHVLWTANRLPGPSGVSARSHVAQASTQDSDSPFSHQRTVARPVATWTKNAIAIRTSAQSTA